MSEGFPNSVDEATAKEVETLTEELFGDDFPLSEKVPGKTNDDIVADNIPALIRDPETIVSSVKEADHLVGFSVTVPIGKFDPNRTTESAETAYIYFGGVEPAKQAKAGPTRSLLRTTIEDIEAHGYQYIEADPVKLGGWADGLTRLAGEALIGQRDHNDWGLGPQTWIRVEVSKLRQI